MKGLALASLTLGFVAHGAFADGHASGDAAAGEAVFKKCKSCHSIIDDGGETIQKGGKVGPNLYGIYTRAAGTQADFASKFSKDVIAAGEAGLAWNEADFVKWVGNPRQFLRDYLDNGKAKTKMTFRLKGEEDAANLWAYLVSVGPAPAE